MMMLLLLPSLQTAAGIQVTQISTNPAATARESWTIGPSVFSEPCAFQKAGVSRPLQLIISLNNFLTGTCTSATPQSPRGCD